MIRTVTFAMATLVATGCGGKKQDRTAEGSGSAAGKQGSDTGRAPAEPEPRFSQLPQPVLDKLELPEDPKRAEKIALGHALFFDQRLSGHRDRSCYSCHKNEDGNGGHDPVAIGSGDKPLTRHSPVLWNVAYYQNAFYWDGREPTLEANIKGAWGGANMAAAPGGSKPDEVTAALDKKVSELLKIPGYKKLFDAAFPGTPSKSEHAIAAMASYMRTMVCNETAYDRFAAGDKSALTEQQQRGLDVFLSPAKGNCTMCHAAPHFSLAMMVDGGQYFNVGIGTQGVPEDKVDKGRMAVTESESDWAAFKVPTLRNISKSAPYFHDGSVKTLEEAVRLMAKGGIANRNKYPQLEDRKLSDAEIADLVAFLGALECGTLEEPTLP
jgi:cytochrome c peroxidase